MTFKNGNNNNQFGPLEKSKPTFIYTYKNIMAKDSEFLHKYKNTYKYITRGVTQSENPEHIFRIFQRIYSKIKQHTINHAHTPRMALGICLIKCLINRRTNMIILNIHLTCPITASNSNVPI